jgi:signal transduction histidine kinase
MVSPGSRQGRDLRLHLMNIDQQAMRRLSEFWPLVEPEMPDIVDGFYRYLASVPMLHNLIGADTRRLRSALASHWQKLFSGRFDDSYFHSARTIAQRHHRLGLEPKWYVGGYNWVHERLVATAMGQAEWSRAKIQSVIAAVTSALALDRDIASSAHVDSMIKLERSRQEAKFADAAKQRISRLLSGLPAAIYTGLLEPGGKVTRFEIKGNAERLSGWREADFESWQAWARRANSVDDVVWSAHFEKVIDEGGGTIEYEFRHKHGSLLRLRDQARVIERLAGGQVEIVGYISDITRDHTIRKQALNSAKLATLGEMATGLAHEINQPFAIMSLAAENSAKMLQERGPDGIGYTIDRLHRIRDQAARARTIIDHLRIFSGKGSETGSVVRLTEAIAGALSLVGGALRAGGVMVINELDASVPPVTGGLVLAEQVVVNLMMNALDAMEGNQEGLPRQLKLCSSVDEDARTVSLLISDTGPGIPVTILERLFDPFFTTKEVGQGIGLGLSICHGIMTSFGGSIAADNALEGGALFTLTFQKA